MRNGIDLRRLPLLFFVTKNGALQNQLTHRENSFSYRVIFLTDPSLSSTIKKRLRSQPEALSDEQQLRLARWNFFISVLIWRGGSCNYGGHVIKIFRRVYPKIAERKTGMCGGHNQRFISPHRYQQQEEDGRSPQILQLFLFFGRKDILFTSYTQPRLSFSVIDMYQQSAVVKHVE